jgi:cobalt-zinc-cadmium efflux system outer membrane protein
MCVGDDWDIMKKTSFGNRTFRITVLPYLFAILTYAPCRLLAQGVPAATVSPGTRTTSAYWDPVQGATVSDLVRRSLVSNGDLAAARLDVERARARQLQAGLRPNPSFDFEHESERITGTGSDHATSIGIGFPIELGGKRGRRISLAEAELEAAKAEVSDRERRLAGDVAMAYSEALGALREFESTEGWIDIHAQMVRFVQIRVNEGDSAPLELSLLQVEADRMRFRRGLAESRLQSAIIKLKTIAGVPRNEPFRLGGTVDKIDLPVPPATEEASVELALRARPDLQLARLTEAVAEAGLQLARAQAAPNMTVFGRYSSDLTVTNLPAPLIPVPNYGRQVALGVSVDIPIFNKNQGAKAEANAAILQARARREYLEQVVRSEVSSAFQRYVSAASIIKSFEQGVIERSNENIRVLRAAYETGAYPISDLLTEQRRLNESQRDFTEAFSEQYRALIDLDSAIGALSPTAQTTNSK